MSDATKKNVGYSTVVLFLLACLFIYVFYRPEGTLINIILRQFFSNDKLLSAKEITRHILPLSDWVVYSLPGGLWVFATTVLAKNLKVKALSKTISLEWLPMAFALWLELWQLVGVIKGHFDWVDVLLVITFGLAAIYMPKSSHFTQGVVYPLHKRSAAFLVVFVCVFLGHVFT